MERYPYIKKGRIKAWLISSSDFTVINSNHYMWITSEKAVKINDYLKWPVLEVDGEVLNYPRLVEDISWPYSSVAWNWSSYTNWLRSQIPEGLKVVLNFSGGKDSVAAAKALVDAGADVTLLYSHVSYLEPERNKDFVERAAERLGVKLIPLEADKDIMKSMLEKGMPFRGNRWCTFMKVRPIKKVLKEMKGYARADGERMLESLKRFKRLKASKLRAFDGARVRPIYLLTLIDVVKVTREIDLVHPDYLMGLPRVACAFCPYRALHEFTEEDWKLVEDPGLIESAIKASYKKHDYGISWEEFLEMHMWRFSPILGKKMYKIKKSLDGNDLEGSKVNKMYKSIWIEKLPKPRELTPEEAFEIFEKVVGAQLKRAKEGFEMAQSKEG
ncbi:hypothetical protein IPA_00725 [Ignicoccus pacificus DSM 13166]|uniref:Phosphoadenosine phosphosulphate reductase domain-containing protein n=1 Tax=Ignicoccus pacificus DSM 13166 TaxID=940294 RepID=A0A977KAD5_9CREN|nr:hypothetical protein IPA_00725 [Ignicoccus pacificus DSM 13166]